MKYTVNVKFNVWDVNSVKYEVESWTLVLQILLKIVKIIL